MTSSSFRSVMAFIFLLLCSGSIRAADQLLLDALATLPPKYLADVPEKDRDALIRSITGNPEHFHREGGWAHWFSDGRRIPATSMFWLKELPEGADARLLFVHMSKPFADGRLPSNDQTFVLRKTHDTWVDVTREVIPSGVDLTLHFRPMKSEPVIQVARWKRFERKDGRGRAWGWGQRIQDLRWTGEKFEIRTARSGAELGR